LKVASVEGLREGRTIQVDAGADAETAVIAAVGTAGATKLKRATSKSTTELPVADAIGFRDGETITIGSGTDQETASIVSVHPWGDTLITLSKPLTHAHDKDTAVYGSGITLSAPLASKHAVGSPVSDNLPTPGAPNRYYKKAQ
jgi:hypothetical protein